MCRSGSISPLLKTVFRSIAVVVFFAFSSVSANDNIQQLQFKRFTVDDGLPNNYSETVFVDSQGFVWIGGQQGLSMFDAYTFTNYVKIHNDSTSLSSNYISDIFESRDGAIWIGTYNGGLLRFDKNKRNFTRFSASKYGITARSVRKIIQDTAGTLWLGTYQGVFRFDPSSLTAKHYSFGCALDSKAELNATSRGLYCSRNGTIWAGAGSVKGLFVYDPVKDSFALVANAALQAILKDATVRIIKEDSKGAIWICTRERGIVEYSPSAQTVKHYTNENGSIHSSTLMDMYIDASDNIWISSFNNKGLAVLLNKSRKLIVYKTDDADPYSIPSNSISSITQDKDGNYWISTHGGGVAVFTGLSSGFSQYKKHSNNSNSISNNTVTCFAQDSRGAIWVGTDGGGLNKFDRSTNAFKRYTAANGLRSDVVLSILPIENNKLLLAGWDLGICKFNTVTGTGTTSAKETKAPYGLRTNDIKNLFRDSKGVIWHGNHSLCGLSYQLPGDQSIRTDSSLTGRSFSYQSVHYINQVFEDSGHNFWVATKRGLLLYNDSLRIFVHEESDTASLASDNVTLIFEDSQHTIWIGTAEGLQKFDKNTGRFINYTVRYSLPTFIAGILEDANGNLWISSTAGLVKFNPQTGKKQWFDSQFGLQCLNFIERSCLRAADGEMYFGSTNGFLRFYPDSITWLAPLPRIRLTDFLIFNKSKLELLRKDEANGTKYRVEVPYSWSVIGFEYSILNYLSPIKNQYSYILEGFDSDWSSASHSHSTTYTNLDPGTYTFRVRCASSDENRSDEEITVELIILPPFWLTAWFKLLATTLFLILVFGLYFYRIHRLNVHTIQLENEVKHRTSELIMLNANLEEQKEEILLQNEQLELQKQQLEEYNESILRKTGEVLLQREKIFDQNKLLEKSNKELDQLVRAKDKYFSIIAHDLKNPINAIMGFSDLVLRRFDKIDNEKKREFITHINRSSNSIYTLLVNLLDWSRSQLHNLNPTPKNYALSDIFEDNRMLLHEMAQSKGIRLEMYAGESIIVYADINLLNSVLRNLISNSVKFTGRNGLITVIASERGDDMVQISVQDTGVGMEQSKIDTLFSLDKNTSTNGTEHEKGTGLGLLVVHEFVLANGGSITVSSVLGEGTKFSFTVPARNQDSVSEIL